MRTSSLRRPLLVLLAAVLALGLLAPAAQAAPPANDEISHARVIPSVPFSLSQSTRHATTNPATDIGDYPCMGGHSVWFTYRPSTAVTVRVVTLGSDFGALLGVFRGPASNLKPLACSDWTAIGAAVEVQLTANTTYFIAASTCCDLTEDSGGHLDLQFYLPKALSAKVAVTAGEAGSVSGRASLSGTYRCTNTSRLSVSVTLSQRVGDLVARGATRFEVARCSRTRVGWNLAIDSSTGVAFRPGKVSVALSTFVQDGFGHVDTMETSIIRLENAPNARSTS